MDISGEHILPLISLDKEENDEHAEENLFLSRSLSLLFSRLQLHRSLAMLHYRHFIILFFFSLLSLLKEKNEIELCSKVRPFILPGYHITLKKI